MSALQLCVSCYLIGEVRYPETLCETSELSRCLIPLFQDRKDATAIDDLPIIGKSSDFARLATFILNESCCELSMRSHQAKRHYSTI